MENEKKERGIPVKTFDALYDELWRLREMALDIKNDTTSTLLYRMGRVMQEILVYMPRVDDEDLESEEETDD